MRYRFTCLFSFTLLPKTKSVTVVPVQTKNQIFNIK